MRPPRPVRRTVTDPSVAHKCRMNSAICVLGREKTSSGMNFSYDLRPKSPCNAPEATKLWDCGAPVSEAVRRGQPKCCDASGLVLVTDRSDAKLGVRRVLHRGQVRRHRRSRSGSAVGGTKEPSPSRCASSTTRSSVHGVTCIGAGICRGTAILDPACELFKRGPSVRDSQEAVVSGGFYFTSRCESQAEDRLGPGRKDMRHGRWKCN